MAALWVTFAGVVALLALRANLRARTVARYQPRIAPPIHRRPPAGARGVNRER